MSPCPGYNAPYLSVYSENAVDVFDVNTMEWIQTIPLKKVSAVDCSLLWIWHDWSASSRLAPPAGWYEWLTTVTWHLCHINRWILTQKLLMYISMMIINQ